MDLKDSTADQHSEESSGLCILSTEVMGISLQAWIILEAGIHVLMLVLQLLTH